MLCAFLTGCAGHSLNVPVVIHAPVAVLPPDALFADCTAPASDGTIMGELERMAALVRCERVSNALGRAWKERMK